MRDIYLIDFENVASEGLSGITYLSENDQVIIFYSNNSNRLTMKMHILIGKSVCKLDYFEVTVGGKNALDHQISTWLGYLVGTGAAERNYYIVSRDMGYKRVANFWAANRNAPRVRCVDTIKAASRLERYRREAKEPILQAVPVEQPAAAEVKEFPAPESEAAEVVRIAVPEPAPSEPVAVETEVTAEAAPETVEAAEAVAEEPVDAPQEPAPEAAEEAAPRKNHRSRARVRRSRGRNHVQGLEPEKEAAPAAQETEAPVVAVEVTPEPVSAEPDSAPKQEKKKSASHKKTQAKEKAPENPQTGSFDQLSMMIAPYPKLQESVLRDLIANNKRQILCNTLRKHLGQEKGLALYNEIKRTAWH